MLRINFNIVYRKIAGGLYLGVSKYIHIFIMGKKRELVYNYQIIINIFVKLLSMFILQRFWSTIFFNDVEQYRYMFNYAIISQILGLVYSMSTPWKMVEKIQSGEISIEIIRPINYIGALLVEEFGSLFSNIVTMIFPILVVSNFVFKIPCPSVKGLLVFLVCTILAYLIIYLIRILISLVCFWVIEASALLIFINVIIDLLSGQFLPSWFLPDWLKNIMDLFPFIWTYQKPIEILLSNSKYNTLSIQNLMQVIGMQIFWISGLIVLVSITWKKALNNLQIQGG